MKNDSLSKNWNEAFRQLIILIPILFTLSCCIEPPGYDTPAEAPEIEIEIAWQIAMERPYGGFNSLFYDKYMYYPNAGEKKLYTINLESRSIINSVSLAPGANPVKNGDYIYIPNVSNDETAPLIYICDLNGNLLGQIELDVAYKGCSFTIFSHSNYLYWMPLYDNKTSLVRLDTETITNTSGDNYTADVQVLCQREMNYNCGANPSFYDGKVYLPVNHNDAYEGGPYNSRILIFNETTGNMEQNLELDGWVACSYMGDIIIKSGNNAVVYDALFDLTTGKILKQIQASISFAPLTEYDNCLYGTSSESSLTSELATTVWKLNKVNLNVEWSYLHEYSCGTQPQVVNDIVYVTAPDMIILFDEETGKILGKDTDLRGHPIQHANSYLYGDLMIFHDGYYITAIKTNWKINNSGELSKIE